MEMQTEQGSVFYFESAYDRDSDTTIDTVRGAGKAEKVSRSLEKGNRTAIVMEALFNVFPANVPMPAFQ
ncbi:MAG: hypothetical protein A3I66_12030 [Burkholderiales bacterium RIFCSPLOWO2_02_FULL_57_36]|nr:MAG: hypothetical protein A3I66_12030 [Burkholderiales bacterium RIFCSPLOWO2_02_FULL_57_36]